MSGRAARLQRLLAIRRLNENLDRGELELALNALADVESGLATQQNALSESRVAAGRALADGDRREWLLADAQSEVAGWNRSKLKALLPGREEAASAAMTKFLGSRREHEQAKQLVSDAEQAAMIDADRKAQAAADDWFLSRREQTDVV